MEFHLRDYTHRFLVDFFFHSSSQCTICGQENVASSSCSSKGELLNNCHHQLLLWELARSSSWEEDNMLSACSCARSLRDHKLPANGAHFTGETVTRGAPTITLPCFLSLSACFGLSGWARLPPSQLCGHVVCIVLGLLQLLLGYCHCVVTLFLLMSRFCFFLKLYSTENLSRQNSFVFLLNYLYTRYDFP